MTAPSGPAEVYFDTIRETLRVAESRLSSLAAENAAMRSERETWIQAVGLASTCAPSMLIDVSDPIGMMQQVCRENAALREDAERLNWLEADHTCVAQEYGTDGHWWSLSISGPHERVQGRTLREAIDAAMSAGVSPPESEKP